MKRGRRNLLWLYAVVCSIPLIAFTASPAKSSPGSWRELGRGVLLAAWAEGDQVTYIPTASLLGEPDSSDTIGAAKDAPIIIGSDGSIGLPTPPGPPPESGVAEVRKDPYLVSLTSFELTTPETEHLSRYSIWRVQTASGWKLVSDVVPETAFSPSHERACVTDSSGTLRLLASDGTVSAVPGLPEAAARRWVDWTWSADGLTLFVASEAARGLEAWKCPLTAKAEKLGELEEPFCRFLGVGGRGPLYEAPKSGGYVIREHGPKGLDQLWSGQDILGVSSGGKYVLGLAKVGRKQILTLTTTTEGKSFETQVPLGLTIVYPDAWPGSDSLFALFAHKPQDYTETYVLVGSFTGDELNLRMVAPPSKSLSFDLTVPPVVIGPALVSLVTTDRDAFLKSQSLGAITWVVDVSPEGGR